MTTANDRQVGGSHYQCDYQTWDFLADAHGIPYHIGNAIKYIQRYRSKSGLQDLEKAIHYIDKIIELAPNHRYPQAMVRRGDLQRYLDTNGIEDAVARQAIGLLLYPEAIEDELTICKGLVQHLIDHYEAPAEVQ